MESECATLRKTNFMLFIPLFEYVSVIDRHLLVKKAKLPFIFG